MEKYILRKAFDTPEDPYLPAKILWRQKEQFSDGVGYGWIDALKDHAALEVSDLMFKNAENRCVCFDRAYCASVTFTNSGEARVG
eukprot:37228-Eustigmatos_ZCMA.PRE.1